MAEIITFLTNSLVIAVLLGYIVVLWAALTIWAAMDIFVRSRNWFVRIGSVLLVGLGFFFGFILYLIIRPQNTLDDQKIHELEERMMVSQTHTYVCPACSEIVRDDFLFCSNCGLVVRKECPSCKLALEIIWQQCPFCGINVGGSVIGSGTDLPKLVSSNPSGSFLRVFKNLLFAPKEPVEIKRGRGRPRKPLPETPVVKRRRGRPRKDESIEKSA